MRITVTIADALYARALDLSKPGTGKAELLREALQTFVRIRAGQRLAALGGQAPEMEVVPRRREEKNR